MKLGLCRRGVVWVCICVAFVMVRSVGCGRLGGDGEGSVGCGDEVLLSFSLELDPNSYSQTRYKKPPQFAIWIEEAGGDIIRTVWVTRRTARGDWGGKVVRPVSLPYWVSRWNKETGRAGLPSADNPVIDAATGPTPKLSLMTGARVPMNGTWRYYVEVNVSGDYNAVFGEVLADGRRDVNGNGEPSIIYQGQIRAVPGQRSVPELIGRTDQFEGTDRVITDLEGISLAKSLLSKIEVAVRSVE